MMTSTMLLTLLLLAVVTIVHGRYASYQKPTSNSQYEERLDDYSPLRYHETIYISEDADLWDRGGAPVKSGLTQQQRQDILDHHNKLRAGEGASNMEVLRWNDELAKLGQQWADRCNFEHGQPPFNEQSVGHKHLGQNIWANTDPAKTVKDAVQAWFDEKSDFNYDSLGCTPRKMCGHYTQVVWGKTRQVGCGITNCSSISGMNFANYIVCNYGPPGNFHGEKPFKKGPPCTGCDSGKFFCSNNLCDFNCNGGSCSCMANCGKCGTKTNDCKCQCKPGFGGVACNEECRDKHPKCGGNPGWPSMWCNPGHQFVLDGCPKLCNLCKPGDGSCSLKYGDLKAEEDVDAGKSNFKAELSEFVEKIEGELLRRSDAEEERSESNLDVSEDQKLADLIKAVRKLSHN